MTDNSYPHTSPNPLILKWIKIIAIWTLVTAGLNLFFYGLVQFALLKGSFSLADHVDVLVNSLIGLLTFQGLRRHASWGWKLAVVAIPASWLYGVYSISQNYQPGMGVVTSTFLFIDTAIIMFLFTPEVRQLFHINSFWPALSWINYPLLVTAVFLISFDFFGNLGAIINAFIVFTVVMAWQQFKQAHPDKPDN